MPIKLDKYSLNKEKYKTQKASTLHNARQLYKERNIIIDAFENAIFPLPEQPRVAIGKKMRWIYHNPSLENHTLYHHHLNVKKSKQYCEKIK